MEPKQYLRQAYNAELEIKEIKNQYWDIKSTLFSASILEGDLVKKSKSNSNENKVLKILDYWEKLNQTVDKKIDLLVEISDRIDRVEDSVHRKILKDRYISMMEWQNIADDMNYTVRHVTRLHGTALQNFEKCNADLFQ